jgi:hypothetical protein
MKKDFLLWATLLLSLALGACALPPVGVSGGSYPTSAVENVIIACATASQAINVATLNVSKLDAVQRATVTAGINTIRPICDSTAPPTGSALQLATVQGVINGLAGVGIVSTGSGGVVVPYAGANAGAVAVPR